MTVRAALSASLFRPRLEIFRRLIPASPIHAQPCSISRHQLSYQYSLNRIRGRDISYRSQDSFVGLDGGVPVRLTWHCRTYKIGEPFIPIIRLATPPSTCRRPS